MFCARESSYLPDLRKYGEGEGNPHPGEGGKELGLLRFFVPFPEHLVRRLYLLGEGESTRSFPERANLFSSESSREERNSLPEEQKRSRKGELRLDPQRRAWMEFPVPVLLFTGSARYLKSSTGDLVSCSGL